MNRRGLFICQTNYIPNTDFCALLKTAGLNFFVGETFFAGFFRVAFVTGADFFGAGPKGLPLFSIEPNPPELLLLVFAILI
jgi:hypothetical protein